MKKYYSVAKKLSLFALLIYVFFIRLIMLLQSSEPAGLDGYFYALQAKSFALNGVLENPDYKIGYYLCGIFAFIFKNPILGCKIYAALISSLLVYSVFRLLKSLKTDFNFSICGAVLCSLSFSTSIMCINFINNLTGITFSLLYASALIVLDSKSEKRIVDFIPAVVFFVLSILSHLVAAAFVFIFTVLFLIRKLSVKKQLILLIAAILFGLIIFSSQFSRFKSVFSLLPVLPVFSDFMRKAIGLRVVLEISIIFVLCWIIFIVAFIKSAKNKKLDFLLFGIPVLFFPFWNLNILDMGYRMFLSAVPCGIVIIVYFISKIKMVLKKSFVCFIVSIVLLPFIYFTKSAYDVSKDPPYKYYKKIAQQINLPDDSLLIAHLGMNHVYTYYNNLRDALNYEPDFFVEKEKLWRLVYGVNYLAIEDKLFDESEETINNNLKVIDSSYILIREDLWKKFLEREEDVFVENYLNWFNPHTVRPTFIRKTQIKKYKKGIENEKQK